MRDIEKIIIHCSATVGGVDFDRNDIDKWHKQRGWSGIGYHYVVKLDGNIQVGRSIKSTGAHAKGYNSKSIGICYIGGLDRDKKAKDTRTEEQKESLIEIISFLKLDFPDAEVLGHNDLSNKSCPCFNAKNEYKNL